MTENSNNPFFNKFDTPHGTFPFDKIRMEHYEEAFMEGMRREKEHLEKMLNDGQKPTFDNTIIDKDDTLEDDWYYGLLDRVCTCFFNLLSTVRTDEMDALAEKMQPLLSAHASDIGLDSRLFERIKHVHRFHRILDAEEKRLLDNTYRGFTRSGALLDDGGKEKLRELRQKLGMLGIQFSQNQLKEEKAFTLHITDGKDLKGLPDTAVEAAALAAREREMEGWVFTLDQPSYGPFLMYCENRELRRQMYMARNTICTKDNENNNLEICRQLVNLRLEVAQLLGNKTVADSILKERMASNKKNVYGLLYDLIDAYKPVALKEQSRLLNYARKQMGKRFEMEPWDVAFFSNKLKKEKYDVDPEKFRPYLELSKVIDGVFSLANKLYGITFKENKDIPVYHPDVKAYEVFDEDGSYLAVFYADFHPREGKRSGAWMTEFQGQYINRVGENIRPHVSVVMNLSKPTEDKPALLTLGEVETFLHEFGHSLHGMFANTRFGSMSGTNVMWDFVELPSQLMENFVGNKQFLDTFACHYQTGEPLPEELLKKAKKSSRFLTATACMRQVSLGLLDMAYYTRTTPLEEDIMAFEKEAWKDAIITPQKYDTCMSVQFSHIMTGGYVAGYYSYKWAEVLEADAFSVFKKNGTISKDVATRFRKHILSKGGTVHPMILYKRFRGKEPSIDALLRRSGIKPIKLSKQKKV